MAITCRQVASCCFAFLLLASVDWPNESRRIIVTAETYQEVCYTDLGCFSAFGRIALLPETPAEIGTTFLLYTRQNTDIPDKLLPNDADLLAKSRFSGQRPTKMIIHGWNDDAHDWVVTMAKQFLINEDCNVFLVKWAEGGFRFYAQSAANSRVAGAQVAQFVTFLTAQTKTNISAFHILGHSMGAHVAGYAGERLPGLPRITGLDPADPYFQNFDPAVRLDETDALFVDVVHADAGSVTNLLTLDGGLGLWQPSGHIDIYPNGGINQPGCDEKGPISAIIGDGMTDGLRYIFGCNHVRGYEYPTEVITSGCPWRAYRCEGGWDEFKTGRCLKCPAGDKSKHCNSMVNRAVKPSDGSVNNMFWLGTGDKKPYCRYHFHIRLTIDSTDNKEQRGIIWVKLSGDRVSTDFIQLGDGNFYVTPGATYDFLVLTKEELSSVSSVEVKWEHDAPFYEINQWQLLKPVIYPSSITVFSGEFQNQISFCDKNPDALKSKGTRLFSRAC